MRHAFVLAVSISVFVGCDGEGIRYEVPGPDSGLPYGLDGGLDGSLNPPPEGDGAPATPENDADIPGPTQKNASMVSVPPAYTVAEEPYKYTPKANGAGDGATVKVKGPEGMQTDGVSVAWEPTKNQGGEHTVTVTTKASDQTVSQEYSVTVAVSTKQADGTITQKNGGQVTVTAPTSKAQGAGVSVSSGAIAGEATVTVAEVDKSPPMRNTAGAVKAIDFGERGLVFGKPVTVSLPLPQGVVLDATRLGAFVYNPKGLWERVPVIAVDLENQLLLARAQHFSLYASAQSALDFDSTLARMGSTGHCPLEVVASAALTSSLSEVEALSINNLTPELRAQVEADDLSVDDLIRSPDFSGSLRAVTVYELLDEAGVTVSSQTRVRTLYVGDERVTLTHTTSLGLSVDQTAFPSVASGIEEISARLRGQAGIAHLGEHALEKGSLAARIHFIYDPEDLSLEAVDGADLGLAAAQLTPAPAAALPVAAANVDIDCDGLAALYDDIDNRLLPGIATVPADVVPTLVGTQVLLRAELVNFPAATQASWEVLNDAPGQLEAGTDGDERVFSASEPGRYYVRTFAQASGETVEALFAIDVLAMGTDVQPPSCAPSAAAGAVKIGDHVGLSATLGDSSWPAEAVRIEWGLVFPELDPSTLEESAELTVLEHGALFAPLTEGEYTIGCRAVVGELVSDVGTLEVSALPPDANLAPVDLTLSPAAITADVSQGITLHASAVDPDGDELSFSWGASGGNLTDQLDEGDRSSAVFGSDSAGVYEVVLTLTDGFTAPQTLRASIVVVRGELGTVDADGDGWPQGSAPVGDCNDNDPNVYPTALDVCGNGTDEDCDGVARVDDCDDDGYSAQEGDCLDSDATISPEAYELCDGLDNDCDKLVDEGYGSEEGCSVGVGQCAVLGTLICSRDGQYAVCQGVPELPEAELCDGLDNDCNGDVDEGGVCPVCTPTGDADITCDGVDDDCDGQSDEDFVPAQTTCGVGACAAVGESTCVASVPGSTCQQGLPAQSDSTCDSVDDDCDGSVDEDFVGAPTSCGEGACAATGVSSCVAGETLANCVAGSAAPDDSLCNGTDDDCDGAVDEDFEVTSTSCGEGACGSVGSLSCVDGRPIDSCQAGAPANGDASCNGIDDDCDGVVDDEYQVATITCGTGACQNQGSRTCVDGNEVDSCEASAPAESDASCDNVDNDCNGQIDEDYVPTLIGCGVGACENEGSRTCRNGSEVDSCEALTGAPNDITCDNIDDDCDGETDEDYPVTFTSCGIGACENEGARSCVNGVEVNSCQALAGAPSDITCNNVDDDCDGETDEDYVVTSTSCGTGACGNTGSRSCVNGVEVNSCQPLTGAPSDITCNNVDDDCDGRTDDDYVVTSTSCGIGACGNTGSRSCVNGVEVNSCQPLTGAPSDVTCDNVDDDCNGANDEDYVVSETSCGTGACENTGTRTCVNGAEVNSCQPLTGEASDASCDNVDNDCNGATDEDYVPPATECGVGACHGTGVLACQGGVTVDTCEELAPEPDDASCDGIDNDCDGLSDEEYVVEGTVCGTGACGNEGAMVCVDGVEQDTCTPREAALDDRTCDGADDDCDGLIDEDYAVTATGCGIGACENAGSLTCVDGVEVDTCLPREGAPDDASCDGVDSDCDDLVDEDYQATGNSCGVGECANVGTIECIDGLEVDTCTPAEPTTTVDDTCNLADENCNGEVDEDFAPRESSCGLGVCASQGIVLCENGFEVDSCVEGDPTSGFDTVCNGEDDDCDGAVDEEHAGASVSCGVGACGAFGELVCENGEELNTCNPSAPLDEVDDTCDDVDDDCDEAIDEEYVASPCAADAFGQCANGFSLCSAGGVESCVPGEAMPEICNGIDDDCDGVSDEGVCGTCQPQPEICNGFDDDCDALIDEDGVCGTCQPQPEICNGFDDDCDALIDEDGVCGGTCQPQPEVCNGFDDDCDGFIDEDRVCEGGCAPKPELCNGFDDDCDALIDEDGVCNCQPQPEFCDGLDNDCDGFVDENNVCNCEPLPEICNGFDDDCDGFVDEGQVCGECKPSPEICDELDNDCDGQVDENNVCNCEPLPEICNGFDDDCNGITDDLPPETCETPLPGICTIGHFACVGDKPECVPNVGPFPENGVESPVCTNEADDDCDGLTDREDPSCECNPLPEECNDIDDDCDGLIDEQCGLPPGETCENAEPIAPGGYEFNLDDHKDDGNTSCTAPGDNDRWFVLNVPQGPMQELVINFDGFDAPDGFAVRRGPCQDATELFCGKGGENTLLEPGVYHILIEAQPASGGFFMSLELRPPQ
jgi:Notch-like protein